MSLSSKRGTIDAYLCMYAYNRLPQCIGYNVNDEVGNHCETIHCKVIRYVQRKIKKLTTLITHTYIIDNVLHTFLENGCLRNIKKNIV